MSVDGTWEITMTTPMGAQKGTLTLSTDGSSLTGSMGTMMGTVEISEGTVDGDNVTWQAKLTAPMPMTLECSATVDGDAISGEAKMGAFGTAPFSGSRTG